MKRKLYSVSLVFLLAILLVITGCSPETTQTPAASTAATSTPAAGGESYWWDKFGEPQYGGSLNIQTSSLSPKWDTNIGLPDSYLYEPLFASDWTRDRVNDSTYSYHWVSPEYWAENLAESWEWQDPQTVVIKIKEGIHWQDKEPVNGREFTAYDVEHHYHRIIGIGSGYTEPQGPTLAVFFRTYESVTALDNYTVAIKFKNVSVPINTMTLFDTVLQNYEAPELIEAYGNITDWTQVVSTGPWLVTDYIAGSSLKLSRNPNYWGYDERYPENSLPYLDEIDIMAIPDVSTAISALRTGKIDILADLDWQRAKLIEESNPELLSVKAPQSPIGGFKFRCDKEPFTDINVRKAMQMAIDLPLIAETYFGGTTEGIPCGLAISEYKGWGFPYEEWPQSLKDEYSYDPDKARQLLAEAGYPEGFSTSIVAPSNLDLEILEIVKAQLFDIGVDVEIEVMDPATAQALGFAGKVEQLYYSQSIAASTPTTGAQVMGMDFILNHNDANYQALLGNLFSASDFDEAKQFVSDCDRYFLEQHWCVQGLKPYKYTFWNPSVKGYSGESTLITYTGPNPAMMWARLWVSEN